MDLTKVDITAALRRLAERRIEEAMREGKFDNLPGAGKPIELEDMPADEGTRMMWWALRILRKNDFIPDEVRWLKALDRLREALDGANDEQHLAKLVGEFNELVHNVNTMGTNALRSCVSTVDLETERQRMRDRLAAKRTTK
jgi:hypothetical protein